tara:strand:- start:225 stop:533 length:309 start_codon:yes stop_codon:yes gene_type:complete
MRKIKYEGCTYYFIEDEECKATSPIQKTGVIDYLGQDRIINWVLDAGGQFWEDDRECGDRMEPSSYEALCGFLKDQIASLEEQLGELKEAQSFVEEDNNDNK